MSWTIESLAKAYREKKTSPTEVVKDYLNKIKKSNHNSYLTIDEEGALKGALKAEASFKNHQDTILTGIPLGIKDLLVTKGVRTTAASKILENYLPPYTATCVERLETQGMISLGKINMDEFGMGSSNENSAFGPVLHPTHADRVPGGSSGGSATAVGADLCVAALGTDTGGSIRLPASFCGIVGVKPTYGRVSRYGVIAFASSLDQAGPMTKTVQDAAYVLESMAGFDENDSTSSRVAVEKYSKLLKNKKDLNGLRIGVPKEYFRDGIGDQVRASIEDSLKWYESKGAKLVPISLPNTDHALSVYYIVAVSEASSNLSRFDGVRYGERELKVEDAKNLNDFYKKNRSLFGSEVKRRILLGTFALSSGYYDAYYKKACQVRRLILNDFLEAFQSCDVIMSPVAPQTAFKRGEKVSDPLAMYLIDLFTIPASLAGMPALSIPCAKDSDGLSIGLQMIGPHFAEGMLLQVAHEYEKEFGAL